MVSQPMLISMLCLCLGGAAAFDNDNDDEAALIQQGIHAHQKVQIKEPESVEWSWVADGTSHSYKQEQMCKSDTLDSADTPTAAGTWSISNKMWMDGSGAKTREACQQLCEDMYLSWGCRYISTSAGAYLRNGYGAGTTGTCYVAKAGDCGTTDPWGAPTAIRTSHVVMALPPTPSPTPAPTPAPPTRSTLLQSEFKLEVPDQDAVMASSTFRKGVCNGIASFLGVPSNWVHCKFGKPTDPERLLRAASAAGPLLCTATVIVDNTKLPKIASDELVAKIQTGFKESSSDPSGMLTALKAGVSESGSDLSLTSMTNSLAVRIDSDDMHPATSLGDPHVTNVRGESFEIMKTGKMSMLHIPRGSNSPDLVVHADIVSLQDCKMRYIKNLQFTGKWFGALDQMEFAAGGMEQPNSFQARVGQGPWVPSHTLKLLEQDLQKGGINASASAKWFKNEMQLELRGVRVRVWQNRKNIHIKKETSMFLNLAVDNLKAIEGVEVGGLLGVDDHTESEQDDGCAGEKSQGQSRSMISLSEEDLKTSFASASMDELDIDA